MQLLIDFGNTRIKWAMQQQGEFAFGGEAAYKQHSLQALFEEWWDEIPSPVSILCASVTSEDHNQTLDRWCRQHWQQPVTWLHSVARQHGVTNAYRQPHTLGCDRWAALIAAHRLTSHHVGIIDCGSAITLDLLHADGRHQGGYIIPGLWMMQQCLLSGTERIKAAPILTDQLEPGDSTETCISHGAMRTVVALLDSVMLEMQQQYDNRLEWLLTGGDARRVQQHLRDPCRLIPDLVLRGLAYLVEGDE